MKWLTHQTGAAVAAFALQMPLGAAAAAFAGAVLPDVIDQAVARLGRTKAQRQKIFNRIHRGSSHWFGWWLGLFIASAALPLPLAAKAVCAGLFMGATSHVLLDMLTTRGVPLLPFSHAGRFSLGLCATGKAGEYAFLLCMVIAAAFFMGEDILAQLGRLAADPAALFRLRN